MKLVWITDMYLNFIEFDARKAFYQGVVEVKANAMFIRRA